MTITWNDYFHSFFSYFLAEIIRSCVSQSRFILTTPFSLPSSFATWLMCLTDVFVLFVYSLSIFLAVIRKQRWLIFVFIFLRFLLEHRTTNMLIFVLLWKCLRIQCNVFPILPCCLPPPPTLYRRLQKACFHTSFFSASFSGANL